MGDVALRIKPPGMQWGILGEELYPGLLPEDFQCGADPWGFATCNFTLPRDPALPHPDLSSWTPCEAIEEGAVLFEGRVQETPSQGKGKLQVAGRGLQYALDDNPIDNCWMHSNLGDWVDTRTLPGADLAAYPARPIVEVGNVIRIGWPTGTPYQIFTGVGVTLDLGPNRRARGVMAYASMSNPTGAFAMYIRGSNTIGSGFVGDSSSYGTQANGTLSADIYQISGWGGGSFGGVFGFNKAVAFGTPLVCRYIHLFLYAPASSGTTGADHILTVNNITVFGNERDMGVGKDTTGQNTLRSNLRASEVVRDAVRLGAPKIVVADSEPEEFADEVRAISGTPLLALPAIVSESGPARWWRSSKVDSSGFGGNLVTGSGGVDPAIDQTPGPLTAESEAAASKYMRFNGSNSYLTTPSLYAWDFTIFLLFRTSATQGTSGFGNEESGAGIVALGNTAATPAAGFLNCLMGISGGVPFVKLVDPSGNPLVYSFGAKNDGKWHSFCFGRFYRSGNTVVGVDLGSGVDDEAHFADGNYPNLNHAPAANWHIGAKIVSGIFNGDLAEIAVFPHLLSTQQMRDLHRAALARVASPVKRTLLCLPSLSTSEPRTPREVCEGVNTYHRYLMKVGSGAQLHFRPQPTVPKFVLTQAAVDRFLDASLNSGDEQYSRVLVVGNDTAGRPVQIERVAGQLSGARLVPTIDHLTHRNPDAEAAGTAGWRSDWALADTIRSTTTPTPRSGAACIWSRPGSPVGAGRLAGLFGYFDGTFLMGRRYRLSVWLKADAAAGGNPYDPMVVRFGKRSANDFAQFNGTWSTSYQQVVLEWIPKRTYVAAWNVTNSTGIGPWLEVVTPRVGDGGIPISTIGAVADDLTLQIYQGTSSLDRNNDLRTKIITFDFPIVDSVATALADAFLMTHQRVPLRGSVPVGPGDVQDFKTGAPVHPSRLLDNVGELLHLPGLPDPDTGGVGRDGIITAIPNYKPATGEAEVAIDNQRDNFETMLARMALLGVGK